MKKICVVTATRAEYGVLRNLIERIHLDKELELCLIVTGTHLSVQYGYTIKEILEDGYPIAEEVSILSEEDSEMGIIETMSNAVLKMGRVFQKHSPDILIVVGDRYELLPICNAALIFSIPIVHISGGEITEGAVDDTVRHCVTKMSQLHFPGCEIYRERIIQMGEEPDRVFNYGDIGIENINKMQYLSCKQLEEELKLSLHKPYACVTFHPVTMEKGSASEQVSELLNAITYFDDMFFVFTKANADLEGKVINEFIDQYVEKKPNCIAFQSLGSKRYLSLLKESDMIIGNSSSGIIEAPSFKIPTINIGNRQKGRLRAESVIDCECSTQDIIDAIKKARSNMFREKVKNVVNPYGDGNTSELIVYEIKKFLSKEKYIAKHFYDLKGIKYTC